MCIYLPKDPRISLHVCIIMSASNGKQYHEVSLSLTQHTHEGDHTFRDRIGLSWSEKAKAEE